MMESQDYPYRELLSEYIQNDEVDYFINLYNSLFDGVTKGEEFYPVDFFLLACEKNLKIAKFLFDEEILNRDLINEKLTEDDLLKGVNLLETNFKETCQTLKNNILNELRRIDNDDEFDKIEMDSIS